MPIELVPIQPAGAIGYYTTQALIELRFGSVNTNVESDLDNTGNPGNIGNTIKFADVLTATDIWINRALRAAGYESPLPTTSADFPVVQTIATDYARALLHMPRGVLDEQSAGYAGQMQKLMSDAESKLSGMLRSFMRIDCPRAAGYTTAPVEVRPCGANAANLAAKRAPYRAWWGFGWPW